MNYIPGFSNYLQASVPRYANGGAIMDDPRQAAVMPMTQEVAPYDLSALAGVDLSSLYGLNLGGPGNTGLAGLPSLGAGYKPMFEEQLITAPISNKGNPTAYGANNQFYMSPNNLVRIIDRSTNKVLFEGVGYDAAKKAVEIGQNLTDTRGRSASYQIETGTTPDNYAPVANEKYNPSTISKIGNVAGTVLPLAMMAVPGLNIAAGKLLGSQLLGSIALGAGTGGLSAGLKGDNILKGAALGGLTAAGGALIPKIQVIGDLGDLAKPLGVGIGSTVGNLATGQNLKNSLLSGAASGALAYAAPSIQDAFKGPQAPNVASTGSTPASVSSGPAPIATVTGNTSFAAPVNIGAGSSSPTKLAELEPPATIVSGSGSPFAASFPIPASVLSGALPSAAQPEPTAEEMKEILVRANQSYLSPDALASLMYQFGGALPSAPQPMPEPDKMSEEDEILVRAREAFNPVSISSPLNTGFMPKSVLPQPMSTETVSPEEILVEARKPFTTNVPVGGALSPEVLRAINGPVEDDIIKVTGRQTTTPAFIPGFDTPMPTTPEAAEANKKLTAKELADYLRLAGLASSLLGGLAGGDKGGGSGGRIPAGMGGLSSLFSKQLPPSTLLGGAGGGALPASTLAAQGFRSPQNYYRYGYGPEQSFFDYATQGAPNTSRAYTGYEGSTAEDAFAPQPVRLPPVTLPQPITTPVPNNPAAPSMYLPDTTRFARGGFAVEGAGDGRDDKIPALLSDGEYVFDAETVALLGNGSNKAGAKLLDSFRVKVRKQKGKKLARGKFSDNAKRPEQYMAGGPA